MAWSRDITAHFEAYTRRPPLQYTPPCWLEAALATPASVVDVSTPKALDTMALPKEGKKRANMGQVLITVYAPTGYELWGMVHLGTVHATNTEGSKAAIGTRSTTGSATTRKAKCRSTEVGSTKWSCGLEHEVDGVKQGKFDGASSASSVHRWPGGEVLHVEHIESIEVGRHIMQQVATRFPAACSARLSADMQRWENEHGTHAKAEGEGPRTDCPPVTQVGKGGAAATCMDSIRYHGSAQMPSFTRGGAFKCGAPRSAVLSQRGEHARNAGEEMLRLVKEVVVEEGKP
jgi:hypothetical protein